MRQSRRRDWDCVVIVSHSFELIRGRAKGAPAATADWIAVRRFERLCRFLHEHRGEFHTATFSDTVSTGRTNRHATGPLRARTLDTATRLLEQARRPCPW